MEFKLLKYTYLFDILLKCHLTYILNMLSYSHLFVNIMTILNENNLHPRYMSTFQHTIAQQITFLKYPDTFLFNQFDLLVIDRFHQGYLQVVQCSLRNLKNHLVEAILSPHHRYLSPERLTAEYLPQ